MNDMVIPFDTLEITERLERGGFTREQARTQAAVLADVVNVDRLGIVTRGNLLDTERALRGGFDRACNEIRGDFDRTCNEIKADIASVRSETKTEIAGVRSEIQSVRSELKTEIADVRHELKAEIQGTRSELKADIEGVRSELSVGLANVKGEITRLHWVLGVVVTGLGSVIYKLFLGSARLP